MSKQEELQIQGVPIEPGRRTDIALNISRLPTYTPIDLPVRIFRAEERGPVLLLTGGLHGDEINGVEIVRRMIYRNLIMPDRGTVIAIPLVNIYGFIQSARGVPDGKDINRSFPGSRSGSLAKLVAYTLIREIIPLIDVGVDFHTGGASRANEPQLRCSFDLKENLDLATAFSPPVVLHSRPIDKSFRKSAARHGKPVLVYESGEAHRFDDRGIDEGVQGTLRLMSYLGMRSPTDGKKSRPVFYRKSTWVRARNAGLFRPEVELGQTVRSRQKLGRITDPFGDEMVRVETRREGRVIGINYSPVVHKGDALLHLAYEEMKELS
ncbi:MAG: succinylglutamate desuccinylase/aspartoacylase family protein [Balneolaceae bacterium]